MREARTCDSGITVLCLGQAPSCVCCHVESTTGFRDPLCSLAIISLKQGRDVDGASSRSSSINTVSMETIWFQGTITVVCWTWNGFLWKFKVTEPPPFTNKSNL